MLSKINYQDLPLRKLASILIIAIMTIGSVGFLVEASPASSAQPTVILFADSVEEQAAVAVLRSNFPGAVYVDYQSLLDKAEVMESSNPIIWLGHGSEEGIAIKSMEKDIVSWNIISDLIQSSKAQNHYFLSCNSEIITYLTEYTGKSVFSIGGEIDAIWASNFISILIAQENQEEAMIYTFFSKAMKRIKDLLFGESFLSLAIAMPGLPGDPGDEPARYLSSSETKELWLMGFVTFAAVLLPITLGVALAIGSATFWFQVIIVSKITAFVIALATAIDDPRNLGKWGAVITTLVLALSSVSAYAAALAAAIAADQVSWPVRWPAAVIALVAAAVSSTYFVYFLNHDKNDCNAIPAKDEPGALTFQLNPNAGC